ncbi:hypothetical protein PFISCL1PPCAC_12625, partial [Pristionchus fissidentatus]
ANGSCPHYPQFAPTINCPYPGWCLEIINVLVRSGNIPHEYVVDRNKSEYVDWGRQLDDDSFSGILGRIHSGEVDFACLFYQKSIRPTFVVREVPVTIWSLIFNCLKPYDTWVWIAMLAALILQNFRKCKFRYSQFQFAWDVFEQMFNGGKLTRLLFFIFQVGLLKGMYTALLLTALITPNNLAPIKSQNDAVRLIKSGAYKLISDKSQWFAQEIEKSSEAMFIDLREATSTNPIASFLVFNSQIFSRARKSVEGPFQSDSNTLIAVAETCFTFVFSQGLPFRSAHFLVRKGSPWLDSINMEIARNYAMIDQNRQWLARRPICPPDQFATPGASAPLS